MAEDDDYDELVRILAPFRDMKVETGPVTLSDDYVRMIEEVEAAPENQSGADKTWIQDAEQEFREYYERVQGDP